MPATTPEQIHELIEAAFNCGDRDAFVELHDKDATVVVPPEGRRVRGKEAIRAAVEPVFALDPLATIEFVEKVEGSLIALTHARWTLAGRDGGEPVELAGRGTIVSRRQPDGTWRIVIDNFISPP